MPVDDSRRLILFDQARSSFGDEAATTLMDLLPTDSEQLATKTDLRNLEVTIRADLVEFRAEIRGELAQFRADMQSDMVDLRSDMHAAMADLTKTILLAVIGIMLTGITLAFAVARFA